MIPNMFKSVTVWLQKNKITDLQWVLIRILLKIYGKIESLNKLSVTKNLQELKRITIEEWKKISEKTCSNFYPKGKWIFEEECNL